MRSVDVILQELNDAKNRRDYQGCVALCREGILLASSEEIDERYVFGSNLSNCLLKHGSGTDGNPVSRDIEEAIYIYLHLLAILSNNEVMNRKLAATSMGLGWAYYLRIEGDQQDNLIRAINAFTEALRYYRKEKDPYTWASIKAALGLIYSVMESGTSKELLLKSISSYEEALEVLTFSTYPEDWKEITGKLASLRRQL